MRERSRPSYSRSFTLPRDADPSQIDASYSGGVLTLTIHKAEEAKPRNIKIRAS
jgi:HSP20 family protein